jgi:hypothetical protein
MWGLCELRLVPDRELVQRWVLLPQLLLLLLLNSSGKVHHGRFINRGLLCIAALNAPGLCIGDVGAV